MDLAEAHICKAGYGGFSFRDLATEIGIKSASVHHHFPTKASMAAAMPVGTPAGSSPQWRATRMKRPKTLSPRTGQPLKPRSIEMV
jgi:hypothetical protein